MGSVVIDRTCLVRMGWYGVLLETLQTDPVCGISRKPQSGVSGLGQTGGKIRHCLRSLRRGLKRNVGFEGSGGSGVAASLSSSIFRT